MGQHDPPVAIEHHVATQLTTVLAETEVWSFASYEHARVTPHHPWV